MNSKSRESELDLEYIKKTAEGEFWQPTFSHVSHKVTDQWLRYKYFFIRVFLEVGVGLDELVGTQSISHYTGIEALAKIFECQDSMPGFYVDFDLAVDNETPRSCYPARAPRSVRLRTSDVRRVNDRSESDYAWRIAKEGGMSLALHDRVPGSVSFTSQADHALMWQAYGRNGAGVELCVPLDYCFRVNQSVTGPVQYGDEACRNFLSTVSTVSCEAESRSGGAWGEHDTENVTRIGSAFVKHQAFKSENEYRMVSVGHRFLEVSSESSRLFSFVDLCDLIPIGSAWKDEPSLGGYYQDATNYLFSYASLRFGAKTDRGLEEDLIYLINAADSRRSEDGFLPFGSAFVGRLPGITKSAVPFR
jgi:hypothetical protein